VAFQAMLAQLGLIEKDMREIVTVFLNDSTVKERLVGVGILSKGEAHALGCVGPTLRASGVSQDMRQLGYAAFDEISVEPITRPEGDCHARCSVRCAELFQSVDIIRRAVAKIPDGLIATKVTGNPSGEYLARTEQPRGEVAYYLKANGTKNLQRFRVRTPTFANLPALVKMLPGSFLADVPVIVLTIDPCISCTER